MTKLSFCLICVFLPFLSFSIVDTTIVDYDTLNLIENHFVPNSFFKNRYQHYHLEQYLDNYQELIVYQNETVGDFSRPDQLTFSISGSSYKWNRYYINGFRINDVFFTGSSLYKPELYNNSLSVDIWNNALQFNTNASASNELLLQYNKGDGFGGPSAYTPELIHLFHHTAREKMFVKIEEQRMTKNAVQLFANYNIRSGGKEYLQNIQFNQGQRQWIGFDYKGYAGFYPENFTILNLSGELPIISKKLFDRNYYLFNHLNKDHLYAEFGYGIDETAKLNQNNVSFYGTKNVGKSNYTSGLSLGIKNIDHQNINFTRNFVDQDGEGVEPWFPSGRSVQLSNSTVWVRNFNNYLSLKFDGYNSLVNFAPSQNSFSNALYYQPFDSVYSSLYIYNLQAKKMTAGLLENTLGLNYDKVFSKRLKVIGVLNSTFDAMLLKHENKLSPNWEAELRTSYKPCRSIEFTFQIGRKRIPYHFDQVKFLSDNYLSGEVYYWNDMNSDKVYQNGEQSDFFTTTGGKYHQLASRINQPTYVYVDFPIKVTLGKRHSFVLYNQYRKYVNQWRIFMDSDFFGFYNNGTYYLNDGVANYEVNTFQNDLFTSVNGNDNILFDSPFFAGSTIKYQYNAPRFYFSVSWTYHQLIGLGSYGNGILHNDLDVLSESQANPNSDINGIVLLDSDKSFIGRLLVSYNVTKKWSAVFSFKFKDGQTTSSYGTDINSNGTNNQLAVWMLQMKGNNEFNGDHGNREDAHFNAVLRLVYKSDRISANLSMYNIYDFGTDLNEYSFSPTPSYNRYSLELNIPRGLMFTFGYRF